MFFSGEYEMQQSQSRGGGQHLTKICQGKILSRTDTLSGEYSVVFINGPAHYILLLHMRGLIRDFSACQCDTYQCILLYMYYQKSLETDFRLPFFARLATNGDQKPCF